jgi:alpha,alpha-trehalase
MDFQRVLAAAIESVLWNESAQMWFDFDIVNEKQRNYFYPSNLFPLWAECYDFTRREEVFKSG